MKFKRGRMTNRLRFPQPLLSIILFSATFSFAWESEATPPSGYYLVWSDEFNDRTLDLNKWDYWLLGHRRNAINIPNAVSLDGSNLVITTYTSNKVHYTGMIATREQFLSRYGYWESRIRWGDTNGMWSAFWLQSPEMLNRAQELKNPGSEIDIAEHRFLEESTSNIANHIQVNIHWNGYGRGSHSDTSGNVADRLAAGYHTYGFQWTPERYSFLVDDLKMCDGGMSPISHSTEWAILSSEVDDTSTRWAGQIPAEGYGNLNDSTTKLFVDYVRYYAPTNVHFWTGSDSPYWTNSANWMSNLPPIADSELTFGSPGRDLKTAPGRDCSIAGFAILQGDKEFSLDGTNTLTVGASGIYVAPPGFTVNLDLPIRVDTPQTWFISQRSAAIMANSTLLGSATLTKAGPGTLVLNGSNAFSGTLEVESGRLLVGDWLPTTQTSVHGALGGSGVIQGNTVIEPGGTLVPGNETNTLTFSGRVKLSPESTTSIEIDKISQKNARLRIKGTLTGGGNLVVNNRGGNLAKGDTFKIFDADSFTGSFDRTNLPPLDTGLEWETKSLTNGIISVVEATQPHS